MRRRTNGSTTNGAKPAPGDTSLAAAAKRLVKKHGKDRNTEVRKISSHLSLANVWSATQWRAHSRRSRHVRNIVGCFRSTILREIWPALVVAIVWALVVRRLHLPPLPLAHLGFQASSIGLLLVFRTNQAAQRVHDARRLIGVVKTRGIDACASLWVAATDDAARDAAKVAAAYLALMLLSLKGAVRPRQDAAFTDAQDAFLSDEERNWILERQGTPLVTPATIVLRLRYAGAKCADTDARDRYESCLDDVATALGGCKRIYSTHIPPTYSRHASRALVAWLACLPLATAPLHASDWTLALSTGLTAFLVVGIDDLSMQIEEPFAVLPLHDLALELSQRVAAVIDGPAPPGH